MVSLARQVAFDVLLRIESGGWAADLLLERSADLDSRDAGLASEIVFGGLRYQAQLDFLIESLSQRRVTKLDPEVRVALRMGVYQLRYLERIPRHAAVSESVDLVKRARKTSAAGFVNAVLRKVTRDEVTWPDRAIALSMPHWLLERWDRQFGKETADSIAKAFLQKPETYVRVPGGTVPPTSTDVTLEPTEVPGCYRVTSGAPEGLRVMDIGSQSIVPLLHLRTGDRFLDVCAAPGNKTAQALESGVHAIACDLHWHRARTIQGCTPAVIDATHPLPFRQRFNRILVDAPCSGTGTLGRNPEIRWRIAPEDVLDLQRRQVAILRNALDVLESPGLLVYSTCSLEEEEDEAVVREALKGRNDVRLVDENRRIPGRDAGDGFYAAVLVSGGTANG
ncbi:MAG TPA: transcription antitermination factor NusB [Bryobacteraceae bacterium]|nr:transcription antitermination factor NusB [Bryobacteraceae bacterium]